MARLAILAVVLFSCAPPPRDSWGSVGDWIVLQGRALLPNGKPLAGARIQGNWGRGPSPVDWIVVVTGPTGEYRLELRWGGMEVVGNTVPFIFAQHEEYEAVGWKLQTVTGRMEYRVAAEVRPKSTLLLRSPKMISGLPIPPDRAFHASPGESFQATTLDLLFEEKARIHGIVRDKKSGKPIPGAQIDIAGDVETPYGFDRYDRIYDLKTEAGQDGRYSLHMDSGHFRRLTVAAGAWGHREARTALETGILFGMVKELNFDLDPVELADCRLELSDQAGRPIEGMEVLIRRPWETGRSEEEHVERWMPRVVRSEKTDAAGSITVPLEPGARYNCTAIYRRWVREFSLEANPKVTFQRRLED